MASQDNEPDDPRSPTLHYSDRIRTYCCLDCERERRATNREIDTSVSFHCIHCGGPLEETDESFLRTTGIPKADVGRLMKQKVGTVFPFTCPVCQEPFRSRVGLKLHAEDRHEIFDYEPEPDAQDENPPSV